MGEQAATEPVERVYWWTDERVPDGEYIVSIAWAMRPGEQTVQYFPMVVVRRGVHPEGHFCYGAARGPQGALYRAGWYTATSRQRLWSSSYCDWVGSLWEERGGKGMTWNTWCATLRRWGRL